MSLSKCGFLISHLSRICIDVVKFYHNYLTINRVRYNNDFQTSEGNLICISSKLSLPQYLNLPTKIDILHSLTLTFKSIDFYDNIINCNENTLVLDPVRNIDTIYSFVCTKICSNYLSMTTPLYLPLLYLSPQVIQTREYISNFSLSIGTNQHKSNMAS